MIVWSYGGGVQTAAIAVLIAQGKLPPPHIAVIADTGREANATWRYLSDVVRPLLEPLGVFIDIAPHDMATVDLLSSNGDVLIPMFTATGKLPTFCSVEWKRRVVRRWLRDRGVRECDLWLGISVDEVERAKDSDAKWIRHVYPLLDLRLRRHDCLRIVAEGGLPEPPRSSCWMCPHRSNAEWRALDPGERESAMALERDIRQRDPELYLHRDRVPLSQVDLTDSPSPQLELCDGGYCWT